MKHITLPSRAHTAAFALALLGPVACSSGETQTDSTSIQSAAPARESLTSTMASPAGNATTTTTTTTIDTTSPSGLDNNATSGPPPSTGLESTDVGSPSTLLPNPGSVEAGTYTLAALQPSAVIELGDGWWAGWDYGDNVPMPDGVVALEHRLTQGFVRLAFWDTTDLAIGGRQRPDIRDYVRELPTIAGLTEQAIVIGGVEATRHDFGWTGDFATIIPIRRAGYVFAPDEPQHWIVLDTTDGQLLINWTVENAEGAELEAEAETLVGPVLTSLRL